MSDSSEKIPDDQRSSEMPAIFLGHGNPMNAIETNKFNYSWSVLGKKIPVPKAILCISAHWQTVGTKVTAMEKPETIHDFYGFPAELFSQQYQAPGSPELASRVVEICKSVKIAPEFNRGLDHGAWSVLLPMFPRADIPVVQLSLDLNLDVERQCRLARELTPLRSEGVLIIGSGNIVHNLNLMRNSEVPYQWAVEFDDWVVQKIKADRLEYLIKYNEMGQAAMLSVPTDEHYLPMLYILSVRNTTDKVRYFNESFDLASISMRSFILGENSSVII